MGNKLGTFIGLLLLATLLLLTSCDGVVTTDDDNYEPNNNIASAYDFSYNEYTWLSTVDGFGIQADDDWFQVYISSGSERVVVDLQFTHADGDINLALFDPSGTRLAGSYSATDNEHINHTVQMFGTYYIKVYSDDNSNTYDLWWDDR